METKKESVPFFENKSITLENTGLTLRAIGFVMLSGAVVCIVFNLFWSNPDAIYMAIGLALAGWITLLHGKHMRAYSLIVRAAEIYLVENGYREITVHVTKRQVSHSRLKTGSMPQG